MSRIIDILRNEHENIEHFTMELKASCIHFMETGEINMKAFREAVAFIHSYADERHHQKEEQGLFAAMMEYLGAPAEKLIRGGMLVEHDLARLQVAQLEEALNAYEKEKTPEHKLEILASAMGYCTLLKRHIEKENLAVYPFAERALPREVLERLGEKKEDGCSGETAEEA